MYPDPTPVFVGSGSPANSHQPDRYPLFLAPHLPAHFNWGSRIEAWMKSTEGRQVGVSGLSYDTILYTVTPAEVNPKMTKILTDRQRPL